MLQESKSKTKYLLEKSKQLKKRITIIRKRFPTSDQYWRIRLIESKRWLLINKIEDFQKNIGKQVDVEKQNISKDEEIFIQAFNFKDLKDQNIYDFSTRVVKKAKDWRIAASLEKEGKGRYLWLSVFNNRLELLKRDLKEGKLDNMLEKSAGELVYDITGMLR